MGASLRFVLLALTYLLHHQADGRKSKPVKVRLTSDSPAINGSCVSFTAKLEYPPCQKENSNGDLVWDEHCDDGMELEASANGQVRSGPVYNWTSWLEDYGFGKCTDLKTCNVFPDGKPVRDGVPAPRAHQRPPLGEPPFPDRKRERRKYVPLATDYTIYFITDKIPLAVNMSQKAAANLSANVFYRDQEMLLDVKLHDPSGYLKTASSVIYITETMPASSSDSTAVSATTFPTLEPYPWTETDATPRPNTIAPQRTRQQAGGDNNCFRYNQMFSSHILAVSTARESETDISFLHPHHGMHVSDATCTLVSGVVCDDVRPAPGCQVHLRRRFLLPGTYCVNITLGNHASTAQATTSVTISRAQEAPASTTTTSSHTTKVVVTTSILLAAAFAFIAFVRVAADEDAGSQGATWSPMVCLRESLFPANEESRRLLSNGHPL
ncbi:LOW QUALITY PROTEIN: hypothetical protein CRUP_013005 [Coryphaenoides rupestris]|nr:LOW QUALITY PROTEIN: hypothetical protein CRUP_013005 [Coryphaenoides rupestris]